MFGNNISRRTFLENVTKSLILSYGGLFLLNQGCLDWPSFDYIKNKNPGKRVKLAKVDECINTILDEYDSSNIIVGENAPATDLIGSNIVKSQLETLVRDRHGVNTNLPQDFIKLDKDIISDPFSTNKIVIGQETNNLLTSLLRDTLFFDEKKLLPLVCVIEGYDFGKKGVVITASNDEIIFGVGCQMLFTPKYQHLLNASQVYVFNDGKGGYIVLQNIK